MRLAGRQLTGAVATAPAQPARGRLARGPLLVLSLLTAWFGVLFVDPTRLTLPGPLSFVSPYGLLLALLLLTVAAYLRQWRAAPFIALPLLLLWGTLQWLAHWRRVLNPPAPEDVASYNVYFRGTWRIFPESSVRIVPDLYHSVLGALILLALVVVAADLVRRYSPSHRGRTAPEG